MLVIGPLDEQAAGSEREVERTGILLMNPMRRTWRACRLQEGLKQAPAMFSLMMLP